MMMLILHPNIFCFIRQVQIFRFKVKAKDVLGNMSYNNNYQTIETLEEYNPEHEEGCVITSWYRQSSTPADFALPEVFGDKIFKVYNLCR